MEIWKLLLYFEKFPVALLTDTRPEDFIKNAYVQEFGEKLIDSLIREGQREPIIINGDEYKRPETQNNTHPLIKTSPGGRRLYAFRELGWTHCKAVLLTYNFMIPILKKNKLLDAQYESKTKDEAKELFVDHSDHSYVRLENFMNH